MDTLGTCKKKTFCKEADKGKGWKRIRKRKFQKSLNFELRQIADLCYAVRNACSSVLGL